MRAWTASATWSRGASSSTKRSPSASSSSAPSPRIASVTRKPSRRPPVTSAVGWNWVNSRSASAAPGGQRQAEPGAGRSRRVGGARPQGRGTAGGQQHPARGHGPRLPVAAHRGQPHAPALVHHSAPAAKGSSTSMRSSVAASADSSRVTRRPVELPPACTTRRREWPPSRPSARAPERSESKRTPRASRSATRAGRLLAQHAGGLGAAAVAPGRERVGLVELGRVVVGQGSGDAALGPVARGLGQRRARHEHHPGALARGGEGGVEPGGAGADHCQVGLHRGYGNAIAAPLLFSHPSSLDHDTGAHPENARRIQAIEAELGARDWMGWERREAPQAVDGAAAARAPARARGAGARDLRRGAPPSTWTRPPARAPGRPRCGRAGAGCAMVDALLAGEAPTAFCATAPARPPRRAGARDGLLHVLQRRAGGAPRAGVGRRAGDGRRLGRAPRQRDQRGAARLGRRPVREPSPVSVLPGHRAALRRRLGGGGRVLAQPAAARRVG